MKQETFFSFLRMALTAIGTFLIGKNLLGTAVTESIWQLVIGLAVALASIAWSIISKDTGYEKIESGIRQLLTVGGALAVAFGWIKAESLPQITGLIIAVLPFVYAWVTKTKNAQIKQGQIHVGELVSINKKTF